jgi:hypothetical protein
MNRDEARQIYLSLNDADFDKIAREATRWKIKYLAVMAAVWLAGVLTGIAFATTFMH